MIGTLEAMNKGQEKKNIFEENSQEPFRNWWKTLSYKPKWFNELQADIQTEKNIPRCKMVKQGKAKDKGTHCKKKSLKMIVQ